MTYKFRNVYIKNFMTVGGMYEKDGPLGKYLDKTYMESKKRPIYLKRESNIENDE